MRLRDILVPVLILGCALPALAGDAGPRPWKTIRDPRAPIPSPPTRAVLARGDRFEIATPSGSRTVFFRGLNLGAAPPGHYPGEFAITKEDYRRWLRFARSMHANSIRVYALHPPRFYEALREENEAHPNDPIWLFQEVWTELPDGNDFWDEAYTRGFENELRLAIDAVHGNAIVDERPGHASGRYEADVSPWLAGWLIGREWEPYAVRETQRLHPDITEFAGTRFKVEHGTAMEAWLGRVCDLTVSYERVHYARAHAVSFVNWPTLDPMRHPTETERGGGEAEHDEDAYSVDPSHLVPVDSATLTSGFLGYFANYHAYPYYPDFMNLDPNYQAFHDRHGVCSYAGYLADLKAHTRGIPLLIGEYGVPTSRGVAHQQPQGIHHGGATEIQQGQDDVRLLEDIAESGASGSLLFSLFDEWYKVNWLVERSERPRDRDPLWLNRLDPEENYGLLAFDPPAPIRIDGAIDDWSGISPYAASDAVQGGAPLRALYVTSDQTSLYLRLDVAPRKPAVRTFGVSFDVLDPARGDRRLPQPLPVSWSRGAELALLVTPPSKGSPRGGAELYQDRAMNVSSFMREWDGRDWRRRGRAPARPVANAAGAYVPLVVETNRERVARNGLFFPAKYFDWGRLECAFDSLGTTVEIAIPWGLVVGDPSSRAALDDKDGTADIETTQTPGVGLLAWATTAACFRPDSLGPTLAGAKPVKPGEVFVLGPAGSIQSTMNEELTVKTPPQASYSWTTWETPITKERVKRSADIIQRAFEGMEAREASRSQKVDADRP
ncbi:MAG TPA: hypothetical protein VFR25_06880 [Candidatus Eisenbacteria bacterium]|nr:hypothetical protein [Candidatus Eisenbacteria bacterium]